MTDILLPRIIVIGLVSLAWGALIAACVYGYKGQDAPQWISTTIATISGGLLGYVTSNVTQKLSSKTEEFEPSKEVTK